VLATEGDKIDGRLDVLEVWKGTSLKPGQSISVPELAAFEPQDRRLVYHARGYAEKDAGPPKYVTGSRMVLFLIKPAPGSEKWQPAIAGMPGREMDASVVWIEGGELFACIQFRTIGRGADVVPLALQGKQFTGPAFKGLVKDVVDTQTALRKATAIEDPAQRAKALSRFGGSKHDLARQSAFDGLSQCGKAALPVLRAMLADEALAPWHSQVVQALGRAGGAAIAPELTKLLESETEYWKQTAPQLERQWIYYHPALRDRYVKLLYTLHALEPLKDEGCKAAVTALRDFWRTVPQLEDDPSAREPRQICDNILKTLESNR
jgi:hypothetical protein